MKFTPLKYHPRHVIGPNHFLYRKTAKVGVFISPRLIQILKSVKK